VVDYWKLTTSHTSWREWKITHTYFRVAEGIDLGPWKNEAVLHKIRIKQGPDTLDGGIPQKVSPQARKHTNSNPNFTCCPRRTYGIKHGSPTYG